MRHFIGKRIDQTSKYVDRNGKSINVGDHLRYTFRDNEPQEMVVIALDQDNAGRPVQDGIMTKNLTHPTYDYEWERAEALKRNYEVIKAHA